MYKNGGDTEGCHHRFYLIIIVREHGCIVRESGLSFESMDGSLERLDVSFERPDGSLERLDVSFERLDCRSSVWIVIRASGWVVREYEIRDCSRLVMFKKLCQIENCSKGQACVK